MYVYAILFAFTIQSLANWLSEQITGGTVTPTRLPPTFVDSLLSSVPYLLIALLFLYSVYFWLFFSRVLIYIEENDFGEFLSFLLAGVVLGVITTMRHFLSIWPFLVAMPALIVSLKLLHMKRRASDPDDELIAEMISSWLKWTLGVTASLTVLGVLTLAFPGETLNPYRIVANTAVSLALLIGGFVAVFFAAGKIQRKVEKLVDQIIENNSAVRTLTKA